MSSSWPLPPPTDTAADPELDSLKLSSSPPAPSSSSSSSSSRITLSSRSKTALFEPDRFWWGAASVLALWVGYLFQVIAVAENKSICVSWDTVYGSQLPGSCTTSRAVAVITLIAGAASLLAWIALLGVHLLGGGSSLTDRSKIRSLRKRKLRLVLVASGFHWVGALFAVVTCFAMRNFLTEAGLLQRGHYSWCLPLWVIGIIVQLLIPCLMRFTLDTNLDR